MSWTTAALGFVFGVAVVSLLWYVNSQIQETNTPLAYCQWYCAEKGWLGVYAYGNGSCLCAKEFETINCTWC